jgi:hypothetical protein
MSSEYFYKTQMVLNCNEPYLLFCKIFRLAQIMVQQSSFSQKLMSTGHYPHSLATSPLQCKNYGQTLPTKHPGHTRNFYRHTNPVGQPPWFSPSGPVVLYPKAKTPWALAAGNTSLFAVDSIRNCL